MRDVSNHKLLKVASVSVLSLSLLGMTGCQTLKNNKLFGKKADIVATKANKTEQGYYNSAQNNLKKENYTSAIQDLTDLRTFFPVGQYSEQALLDLMYAQFTHGDYLEAATSADRFIQLYPTNPQIDYAYYTRGVANMQAGGKGLAQYTSLNQAHRDISYPRLAFSNFQELIGCYPNSPYAPDAAQRMRYIYNQFAESEMDTARWYIKRKAYTAAANRAKWVFQYYPQSVQVPEAIATLAYSYDKLGMTDTAKQYNQLLAVNYPQLLDKNGNVRLANARTKPSLLNIVTLGVLGRSADVARFKPNNNANNSANNNAIATQPQTIVSLQALQQARQLQLPNITSTNNAGNDNTPNTTTTVPSGRQLNIGLGLPQEAIDQTSSNSSVSSNVAETTIQRNTAPSKTPVPNLSQQP